MTKYQNKKGKTKWKWNETGKGVVSAAKKAANTSWELADAEDQKALNKINKNDKLSITNINLEAFRDASVPLYQKYEGFVNGGFGTLNQIRALTGVKNGTQWPLETYHMVDCRPITLGRQFFGFLQACPGMKMDKLASLILKAGKTKCGAYIISKTYYGRR